MKAIRITKNNKEIEYEQDIYISLNCIGDILYDGDGYRTVKGLLSLIKECRGYIYYEALRYKKEKKLVTFICLGNLLLGIMIGLFL